MQNVFRRCVKIIVPDVYNTHLVTSVGVRMRNPINEKGEWIGWTNEEVAEHLSSLNGGKHNIIVKEENPKEPPGGCGRG
jgi:hypothetical protein